ncbi:hypothetical protein [Nonomuraea africana]|uniref:hypothetical protein n=1 Tax=Nonomuraea africana TaxID=46171 RepID=UPI0033C4EE2A
MTGLREELERLRAQRFAAYPAETLARLALLPQWTESLARRAGLGDVPEELVESTMLLLDDGGQERAFWVRESVRGELGGYLRREHADTLRRALRHLTGRLYGVDHDWFAVAAVYAEDPTGLRLLREVSDRVEAGRLPAAATLVATAEALAEVLGGHLAGSARRAAWRLARATREAEDAHHLRHYQPRSELEEQVVGGPDWAVHLLGAGGAGKTMLIRHLATRITTARVDFDHLDPRYPETRPGEMFTALAVDLLGWVGSRAGEAAYRRFLDAVEELHEELARPYRLETRARPLLERMVAAFADLLTTLDLDVTLVLDTCEELAKLYPSGEPAPGIDMTFSLLERLHALVPSVRVVLAGRRWLVPPPLDAPSGPLLRPRPYLRVLPVGGFTRAEAERYLTARDLPRRFTSAVLARAAGDEGYNPFDLAVYTDWVLAEPSLDPSALVTDVGDPYVERRVIGRLHDPALVRCLGVAAELGTLDRTLAGAEFAALGVDADAVLSGLAAQEWARVRAHTPDGRPAVVELEEHLCARLRAVTAADPDRFPVDGRRLGRTAAGLVTGAESVAEVPLATLLPALRLLPAAEAIVLWREVEDRVVAEQAWGWAEHVTARAAADLTDTADRLLARSPSAGTDLPDRRTPDHLNDPRTHDRRSAAPGAVDAPAEAGRSAGDRSPSSPGDDRRTTVSRGDAAGDNDPRRGEAGESDPSEGAGSPSEGAGSPSDFEETQALPTQTTPAEPVRTRTSRWSATERRGPTGRREDDRRESAAERDDHTGRGDRIGQEDGAESRGSVLAGLREVLAAVLSTQAATRVQTGGGGVAALWRHVLRFGNPAQRDRALLGLVSAGEQDIDFPAELHRIVTAHTTSPIARPATASPPPNPNLAEPTAPSSGSTENFAGSSADVGSSTATLAGSIGALAGSIVAAVDRWMLDESWRELRVQDLVIVAGASADPAVRSLAYGQAALLAQAGPEAAFDPPALAALAVEAVQGVEQPSPSPVSADYPPGCDARARAQLISLLIDLTTPGDGPTDDRRHSTPADEPHEPEPADRQRESTPSSERHESEAAGGRRESEAASGRRESGSKGGGVALPMLEAAGAPTSVDGDRWLSLALLVLQARGRMSEEHLRTLTAARYPLWRGRSAWVHGHVRPLAVGLAESWVWLGQYDEATAVLHARLQEALTAGDDPSTVEECQLALLMVCRRDRDLRHYPGIRELALRGSPVCRAAAWLTLTLVEGEQPHSITEAGSWYGWWRCQDLNSLRDGFRPPPRSEEGIPPALLRRVAEEADHLTLGLDAPTEPPDPLEPRLGWVRGRALLTRAEVLALRFPGQAARLLTEAALLLGRDSVLGRQAELLATMAAIRSGRTLEASGGVPSHPLPGGWTVRTAALSRLPWTSEDAELPELTLPSSREPSPQRQSPQRQSPQPPSPQPQTPQWDLPPWPSEQPPPLQPQPYKPWPQVHGSPQQAEAAPAGQASGLVGAGVVTAIVAVATVAAFVLVPQAMSGLGAAAVLAGAALVAGACALYWSGVPATAMTADVGETSTVLLRHGSGAWRGPAWGRGVPRWPAPSRASTVRTAAGEARISARVKAVRLRSGRDLDADGLEFRLFGHLPADRLPALFRSVHRAASVARATTGRYEGPRHLEPSGQAVSPHRLLWVGALVGTADGPRLRLPEQHPSMSKARERLVGAEPYPVFQVFQAEPVDGPPEPLGDQRAGFVAMARTVCESGTPAALVVPPLPDDVAARVIGACATWPILRKGDVIDARRLLALQGHLREIINAGPEVLCDLILFLPTDDAEVR